MPNGSPSRSAPKSGCSPVSSPIEAINASLLGSTGSASTRTFHGSFAGNGIAPRMSAPGPRSGRVSGGGGGGGGGGTPAPSPVAPPAPPPPQLVTTISPSAARPRSHG